MLRSSGAAERLLSQTTRSVVLLMWGLLPGAGVALILGVDLGTTIRGMAVSADRPGQPGFLRVCYERNAALTVRTGGL